MKIVAALAILSGAVISYPLFRRLELHLALSNKQHMPPSSPSVAFLGDSQISVPNWDALLNCTDTGNYGVGGETSGEILNRLRGIIEMRPHFVVVMAGTNDALRGIAAETTITNLEEMKRELRKANIPHIVLVPPPIAPMPDAINEISDAATLRIPFSASDLLSDGIHLRSSGYAKWRDALYPFLRDVCR